MEGIDNAEWILLKAGDHPIKQISDTLATRKDVASIHIISHGDSGVLRLGGQDVTESTLRLNAETVRSWSKAMTPGADVLLYGCNVAGDDQGVSLTKVLAELTGADVAASTGMTGSTPAADWILEYHVGTIEAMLAFDSESLANYQHTLPITLLDYPSFTAQGLDLNGNATISGGSLQLTSLGAQQAGSAFYQTPIAVDGDTSFQSAFSFTLDGGAGGADGFAFLVQNTAAGTSALGGAGGFLGYDGIGPETLAVEFDTFQNPGWDPYTNQIGITVGGEVETSVDTATAPFTMNNGQTYFAWVDYDGPSDTLSVYLSQTSEKPGSAVMQTTGLELDTIVGNSAYLGFSGATGGLLNAHRIESWNVNLSAPPGGGTPLILLEENSILVNEDSGNVLIEVIRTGDISGAATVDYQTFSQSAIDGSDFIGDADTVSFAPNQASQFVSIGILNDNDTEGTESFTFTIDNPTGGTLGAPRTATIQILDDEQTLPDYPSFTAQGLDLNGNATISGGSLQLTSLGAQQAGSAFYQTPIAVDGDTSFQSAFSFTLDGGAGGADGFAFLVQNTAAGTSALGGAGGFLGYDGIGPETLAVEFDTFQNPGWDPYTNQIGITVGGEVETSVDTATAPFTMNNGQTYFAWVDYNGPSDVLIVYLSVTSDKPEIAILRTTGLELDSIVGNSAYLGFSGATGGLSNAHRIESWNVNLSAPPTNPPINPNGNIEAVDLFTNLNQPSAIVWSPDGHNMYISEKGGVVRVARDGMLLQDAVIDISDIVNGARDRGLLDIAVHPDLLNNPYLYLLYTHDPPEVFQNTTHQFAAPDAWGNRAGQLMRVELDDATNYTTIVAGTETIILGENSTWDNFNGFVDSTVNFAEPPGGQDPVTGEYVQDFIPSDSQSHTIGSLAFDNDGNLLISIGDGASYNNVDPRAIRVQDIDSLAGKILRIDPITGDGISDNPFYESIDPDSNRSRVYQLGLRNPFRITVDDATGELYIGEVGWVTWEELNTGGPGTNFGWPFYEGGPNGNLQTGGGYANLPEAGPFYASGQGTPPLIALNHGSTPIDAIVLGDVLHDGNLGLQYEGDIFFNALGSGIVRHASFDASGNITSIDTFTTGAVYVVDIRQGPDGSLYYVSLFSGTVGRWEIV